MKKQQAHHIFAGLILLFLLCISSGCGPEKIGSLKGMEYDDVTGIKVDLEEFFMDKKVVLVVNFAPWDPSSLEQVKILNGVYEKYDQNEMGILVLLHDSSTIENPMNLKNSLKCEYPFIVADKRTANVFGKSELVPSIAVIDGKGHIVQRVEGFIDRNNLDLILQKYLEVAEF